MAVKIRIAKFCPADTTPTPHVQQPARITPRYVKSFDHRGMRQMALEVRVQGRMAPGKDMYAHEGLAFWNPKRYNKE